MFFKPLFMIDIKYVNKIMMIDGRCYALIESNYTYKQKVYRITYRAYNIINAIIETERL